MKITNLLILLTAITMGSFGIASYCFKNSNVDKTQIAKAFQMQFDNSNDLEEVKEDLDLPAEQVESIEVHSVNTHIVFYSDEGKDVRVKFKAKTGDKNGKIFKYSLEDKNLKIDLVDESLKKSFFIQWDDENIKGGEAGPELKVYVPKDLKRVKINNVNGELKIKQLNIADLKVEIVSGGVRIEDVKSDSISVSQVSGDAKLVKVQSPNIEVNSVSGNVRIEVASEEEYNFKIQTMSGQIRNELGSPENAKGKMKIVSVSGDIKITRTH